MTSQKPSRLLNWWLDLGDAITAWNMCRLVLIATGISYPIGFVFGIEPATVLTFIVGIPLLLAMSIATLMFVLAIIIKILR